MKKIAIASSILLVVFLFGCQSTTVPSETGTSPETSSTIWTESIEHTHFKTTQELLDYLKQNSSEEEITGVEIQNFINDNRIIIYEPTFLPRDDYRLYSIEIWTHNCAYYFYSDTLIDNYEKANNSIINTSIPISSYESNMDRYIESKEPQTYVSGESKVFSEYQAELKLYVENSIVILWRTQKMEDPLAWVIETYSLKPLGNSENPKYYYDEHIENGEIWEYVVYWNTDGYRCQAHIPAALFSEEAVNEICSLKAVTMPLG